MFKNTLRRIIFIKKRIHFLKSYLLYLPNEFIINITFSGQSN